MPETAASARSPRRREALFLLLVLVKVVGAGLGPVLAARAPTPPPMTDTTDPDRWRPAGAAGFGGIRQPAPAGVHLSSTGKGP